MMSKLYSAALGGMKMSDFVGGMFFGGLGGALLRQPEVDAANRTAWAWCERAQELSRQVLDRDVQLLLKENTLRARDAQIERLAMALEKAKAEIIHLPELPPPGSSTHHPNGHE